MSDKSDDDTRWRVLRDVVVFQVKLGMEAVLDITLIPVSRGTASGQATLNKPRTSEGSVQTGVGRAAVLSGRTDGLRSGVPNSAIARFCGR